MSKDALLRFKWTDNGDKKRPIYDCGSACEKLMMQASRVALVSGMASPARDEIPQ